MKNLSESIIISNIQRFCIHDGPGIRTTVFLKGCNIHCPWCANPENIAFTPQYYSSDNIQGLFGKYISANDLYMEILKDKPFYKTEGGVTFSGGEPLLQMEKLVPLMEKCKSSEIKLCAETSLFVSTHQIDIALSYLDTIIIDIKILDSSDCLSILGGHVDCYYNNVNRIMMSSIPVIFRIPLINPYITNEKNIKAIISFLKNKRYDKVELIKGHNLATKKYVLLRKEMYRVPDLSEEQLLFIKEKFIQNDINAEICKM
ncbi:4Fe-4S cluster-binding domain-containing protein [Treponema brennaborense]|uniref:(Formate-C-acetyltransferase)-activating enzyme n=1 Tax=Treponema brennaborense (strain DSM 12168 / CIP 105900 / DD5/3) TaxID=906968 RepID=F4LMG9_TREBD|nr:4Fe-4S cluster-binding domain-containing protein [Treponema brennaborense]AEE15731.1 (Formate-C-acetyltransferase)-activating enzyme [Treponema brennaborense DSM 12168]